ncbi:MAG: 2-C-methyl-D-erythritol 4-phosphate cytidylyltransferase [Pseudomonadales bacterium]|nr:MAG: 2-C-methyl-D-erythritol 4-phosphate cytidylyltransferase [Pseudomonadales bacterium]
MPSEQSSQGQSVWAVVPAAGSGSRFASGAGINRQGSKGPKQYASLVGKPIILRTLEALSATELISCAVVVLAANDSVFSELSPPEGLPIETALGGASRATSVLAGLSHIADRAGHNDWVLVHDAARPLISKAIVQNMFKQLREDKVGGILAMPAHDTVKLAGQAAAKADNQQALTSVERTLERGRVWLAQTPQMFRYGLLVEALQKAGAGAGDSVTDEASAMEQAGHVVRLIPGDAQNIKITTRADMQLATALLQIQASSSVD